MAKLIFLFFFVLIYVLIVTIKKRKLKKAKYSLNNSIIKSYNKLSVPKDKIEIYSDKYYKEGHNNTPPSIRAVDAILNENRNSEQILSYASVIVYNGFFYRGKDYRLASKTIELSEMEILDKLDKIEYIDIYYNNEEMREHYFDLKFLLM